MKPIIYLLILLSPVALNAQSNSGPALIMQGGSNQLFKEAGSSGYSFSLGGVYSLDKQDRKLGFFLGAGWQYDRFHKTSGSSNFSNNFKRHYWYQLTLNQVYLQIGVDISLSSKLSLRSYLGQSFLLGSKFQRLTQFANIDSAPDLDQAYVSASGQLNQTENVGNSYHRMDSRGPDLYIGGNLFYHLNQQFAAGLGISASIFPNRFLHLNANCSNSGCETLNPISSGAPNGSITRLQTSLQYSF